MCNRSAADEPYKAYSGQDTCDIRDRRRGAVRPWPVRAAGGTGGGGSNGTSYGIWVFPWQGGDRGGGGKGHYRSLYRRDNRNGRRGSRGDSVWISVRPDIYAPNQDVTA